MSSSSADGAPTAVACISVSSALGGSEWCLLDFLRHAERHGIRAALLVPKTGPLLEEAERLGLPAAVAEAPEELLALSQRGGPGLAAAPALLRGLNRWAAAIRRESLRLFGAVPLLYSNGFKAHLATALVRGGPRVWHLHEFPPEGLGVVWRLIAGLLPTATIANSRAVAQAWRTLLGSAPTVVLNGVDLDRFRPAPRTFWLHDQIDLPRECRLVGMPAIFARWKGHALVVEAFERAAATVPGAHLVLAGGAIYDTAAERGFAEELVRRVRRSSIAGAAPRPLSDRIHFVRHTREPWRLYPEFDVTIHFSTRPEPFGRVVAESLACGVPPIAARAGGPVEIIEDGRTGWLVTPGDVGELADAMTHALTLPATEAETIGRAGRAAAEQRFSAERFAAEVAATLRRAAAA